MNARDRILFISVAALACSAARAEGDETCARLASFETAQFDDSVVPRGRRWIEMRWVGSWLGPDGWGLSCRHSPDAASRDLCRWLVDNTSYEFSANLPLRILSCHGLRSPVEMSWSDWRSNVGFRSDELLRLLEIDFATEIPGESGAIRYSSFAVDQDDALVEMPLLSQRSASVTEPQAEH